MQGEVILSALKAQKALQIAEAKNASDAKLATQNLTASTEIAKMTISTKEKEILGNQSNTRRAIDAALTINQTNSKEETKRLAMQLKYDLEKHKISTGASVAINADNNKTDVAIKTRDVVDSGIKAAAAVAQTITTRRRYGSTNGQSV